MPYPQSQGEIPPLEQCYTPGRYSRQTDISPLVAYSYGVGPTLPSEENQLTLALTKDVSTVLLPKCDLSTVHWIAYKGGRHKYCSVLETSCVDVLKRPCRGIRSSVESPTNKIHGAQFATSVLASRDSGIFGDVFFSMILLRVESGMNPT